MGTWLMEGQTVEAAPEKLGGTKVLLYTAIDDRQRPTGAVQHIVGGVLQSSFQGLAICPNEGEEGFFLFYCDEAWNTVTDTWHASIEEARAQAEFEYEGVSRTWVERARADQ